MIPRLAEDGSADSEFTPKAIRSMPPSPKPYSPRLRAGSAAFTYEYEKVLRHLCAQFTNEAQAMLFHVHEQRGHVHPYGESSSPRDFGQGISGGAGHQEQDGYCG